VSWESRCVTSTIAFELELECAAELALATARPSSRPAIRSHVHPDAKLMQPFTYPPPSK